MDGSVQPNESGRPLWPVHHTPAARRWRTTRFGEKPLQPPQPTAGDFLSPPPADDPGRLKGQDD